MDRMFQITTPPAGSGPGRIMLPLPPMPGEEGQVTRFEMEVYARFMRHLRQVPNSRQETKVFASIQFTADAMDTSDALVAKTLADLGLRAPRKAFPATFLEYVDKSTARRLNGMEPPPPSVTALRDHWDRIGEDRFSGFSSLYSRVYDDSFHATV